MTVTSAQIYEHEGLVIKIARKYSHLVTSSNKCISMDDLLQEGRIGLFKAISNYDESKAANGSTFSNYAGSMIEGAIVNSLKRGDWIKTAEKAQNLARSIRYFNLEEVPIPELAKKYGVTEQMIEKAFHYTNLERMPLPKPHEFAKGFSFEKWDDTSDIIVADFLGTLSDKHRTALQLRSDGFSKIEIARISGVSITSIDKWFKIIGRAYESFKGDSYEPSRC